MYTIRKDKNTIIRTADRAFIPADEGNVDYQAFKKWNEDGGTSKEEIDDQVIVDSAKESKLHDDLLPTIIDAVQALLNDDKVKIKEYKEKIDAVILSADIVAKPVKGSAVIR
jgi:hypothetical protein